MSNGEHLPNEPTGLSDCLTNDMGRMKLGIVSAEEISELIEKRISVGKRGRSKYGRLVCEAAGCAATCNVEIKDDILVEKDMRQAFELFGNCAVLRELNTQNESPPTEN